MANDFRIALGWITKTALNASSSYLLESFARTSDQPKMVDWFEPLGLSDVYLPAAEQVLALDNTAGLVGGIQFDWTLFLPTPGMVEYIEQTLFGGARSAQFTVQTRQRNSLTNRWVTVWCWGVLPFPSDAEPLYRGYGKYKIQFIDGVLASSGSEFTSEFTYEFT